MGYEGESELSTYDDMFEAIQLRKQKEKLVEKVYVSFVFFMDQMSCKVLMQHLFFIQVGSSPFSIIHRIPSAHVEHANLPWPMGSNASWGNGHNPT